MVNVMYQNDGKSKATVSFGCQIVFFQIRNFDTASEEQLEDSLFAPFQQRIQKLFQGPNAPRIGVPAGKKNFSTCFGPKYSSQALKLIQAHEFRLYYLGMIEYSDSTGRYRTKFCGYTEDDPDVHYVCNKYNDEP